MATMSTTTTTPSDDVVHEILLRVDDVATLFRCAATCRRWRRLVAKPFFLLQRKWPPSLVGYFTNRCLGTEPSPTDSSSRQLAFVPLPGSSLLGTQPCAVSSFIHADAAAATAIDGAMPLATRGGLLLARLYLRYQDRKPNTFIVPPVCNPIVGLAVCNPLVGTWDVLPELNCQSMFGSSDMYGRGIVPSVACDGGGSPAYKVLMIGKDKDKAQYNLHTFVSGEASWRAPAKCFDMMDLQVWSIEQTRAVVCGGYAHWLFASESNQFHVLNVQLETGHVSMTKLLGPKKDWLCREDTDDHQTAMANNRRISRDLWGANRLVITTSNLGTRLSLCSYNDRRLKIWTQHEDAHSKSSRYGDAEWRVTREIDHNLTELILQLENPSCFWSGERSGTLLITERKRRESLYMAHLDTAGTLEEASKQFPDHASDTIMPMEIEDWPTFFMSRLGGPS